MASGAIFVYFYPFFGDRKKISHALNGYYDIGALIVVLIRLAINMNDTNENPIYELKPEINFCTCGCEARLIKERSAESEKGKLRYVVRCLDEICGHQGRYTQYPWQAILEWNKSPMSEFPEDFRIPFMTFAGMSGEEIRQKLNGVRIELEQKIKQLRAEKVSGNNEEMKISRLRLMWVIYAQSWAKLKFPREDELNPPERNVNRDEPAQEAEVPQSHAQEA